MGFSQLSNVFIPVFIAITLGCCILALLGHTANAEACKLVLSNVRIEANKGIGMSLSLIDGYISQSDIGYGIFGDLHLDFIVDSSQDHSIPEGRFEIVRRQRSF